MKTKQLIERRLKVKGMIWRMLIEVVCLHYMKIQLRHESHILTDID